MKGRKFPVVFLGKKSMEEFFNGKLALLEEHHHLETNFCSNTSEAVDGQTCSQVAVLLLYL